MLSKFTGFTSNNNLDFLKYKVNADRAAPLCGLRRAESQLKTGFRASAHKLSSFNNYFNNPVTGIVGFLIKTTPNSCVSLTYRWKKQPG